MRPFALTVLNVQASISPCESSFSAAGAISSRRRGRLAGSTLARLVFIKLNDPTLAAIRARRKEKEMKREIKRRERDDVEEEIDEEDTTCTPDGADIHYR